MLKSIEAQLPAKKGHPSCKQQLNSTILENFGMFDAGAGYRYSACKE